MPFPRSPALSDDGPIVAVDTRGHPRCPTSVAIKSWQARTQWGACPLRAVVERPIDQLPRPYAMGEGDARGGLGIGRSDLKSRLRGDEHREHQLFSANVEVRLEKAAVSPPSARPRLLGDHYAHHGLVRIDLARWIKAPSGRADPIARGPQRPRGAHPDARPRAASSVLAHSHSNQLRRAATPEQDLTVSTREQPPAVKARERRRGGRPALPPPAGSALRRRPASDLLN